MAILRARKRRIACEDERQLMQELGFRLGNEDKSLHNHDEVIFAAFGTKFARDRWPRVSGLLGGDGGYGKRALIAIMQAMAIEGLCDKGESDLIDLTLPDVVEVDEDVRRELAQERELEDLRPTMRKKVSQDQMSLIGWLQNKRDLQIPTQFWSSGCGLRKDYIRKARSLYSKQQIPQVPSFIERKYVKRKAVLGGLRMKPQLQKLYCDLFKENSFNLSGDRTSTRILAHTWYELDAIRYAEQPRILRCLWEDAPELRLEKTGCAPARLQTDMVTAIEASYKVGFDELLERKTRLDAWHTQYTKQLAKRRMIKQQSSVEVQWQAEMERDISVEVNSELNIELNRAENPEPHLQPCSRRTFKKVLAANDVKFKMKVNETRYGYQILFFITIFLLDIDR